MPRRAEQCENVVPPCLCILHNFKWLNLDKPDKISKIMQNLLQRFGGYNSMCMKKGNVTANVTDNVSKSSENRTKRKTKQGGKNYENM